jgi:hypothetical protein
MAVAFGVAIEVSVRQGFLDYVKEREERRLASLSRVLASSMRSGATGIPAGDRELWVAILRQPPAFGGVRRTRGSQERPTPAFRRCSAWEPGMSGSWQPGKVQDWPEMRSHFQDGVVLEDAQVIAVIGQPLRSERTRSCADRA